MQIVETIRISGKGDEFMSGPLPVPALKIISVMAEHGYTFGDPESTLSVMLHDKYDPNRLAEIERIVASQGWDVEVDRRLSSVYDNEDYSNAPLWYFSQPAIWIDEIDFKHVCEECGRNRIYIDTAVRVPEVPSKKPFCDVNGQFHVVNGEARTAIEEALTGAEFHPFDDDGRHFYLTAKRDLGELIVNEDEMIDYRGKCTRCGSPKFKNLFGPLRFAKDNWHGEDIIGDSFFDGILVTPKGFDLLRRFDKKLHRDGIALVE